MSTDVIAEVQLSRTVPKQNRRCAAIAPAVPLIPVAVDDTIFIVDASYDFNGNVVLLGQALSRVRHHRLW